jgi:uroporphyrinogen decarboxylase
MHIDMVPGRGPVFTEPLNSPVDLDRLARPDVDDALGYVFEAVSRTRSDLQGRVPLIGFSGAPWTLMAYMVEGSGSKSFTRPRSWLYTEPAASDRLLGALTDVIVQYLDGQIRAGAQFIQVFESWAGVLGPDLFDRFALPSLRRIASELKSAHPDVPLAVFPRGSRHAIRALSDSDYDVVSVDWTISPEDARRLAGPEWTLQGNLDPAALFAAPEEIRRRTHEMIASFGKRRYIANLGHGMMPEHNPDHAAAFVEAVHEFDVPSAGDIQPQTATLHDA